MKTAKSRPFWPINTAGLCIQSIALEQRYPTRKATFGQGFVYGIHADTVYTWTGAGRMQCENSRALRGSKLKAHVCEFSSQSSDSREETASHFAIYYTYRTGERDREREREKFGTSHECASMPDWPVFHSLVETASFVSMFYFRSSNVSYSRIRHV